jgi:hypothetical protein
MDESEKKAIGQFLHDVAIDEDLHKAIASGDDAELAKYGFTERQRQLLRGGKLTEIRFTIEHETDVHNSPAEAVKLLVTWVRP